MNGYIGKASACKTRGALFPLVANLTTDSERTNERTNHTAYYYGTPTNDDSFVSYTTTGTTTIPYHAPDQGMFRDLSAHSGTATLYIYILFHWFSPPPPSLTRTTRTRTHLHIKTLTVMEALLLFTSDYTLLEIISSVSFLVWEVWRASAVAPSMPLDVPSE